MLSKPHLRKALTVGGHYYKTIFNLMKVITLILTMLFTQVSYSQNFEYTYNNPNDSSSNYYITIKPNSPIKGAVVLLAAFNEKPEQVIANWDFTKYAAESGYLLLIPSLGDETFFHIDPKSQNVLIEFISLIFNKYNLNEESFFIGALQYSKRVNSTSEKLIKPKGIFAIDPPIDIERMYNCMNESKRKSSNSITVQESNYITNRIEKDLQLNQNYPSDFFWNISPFSNSEKNQNSLKYLTNIPIRIYNEPDLLWYYENRKSDMSCLNFNDSFRMINWLKYFGNTKAELIWTTGKGFRKSKDTIRHPHSWSIADSSELIEWLNRNIEK
jgi:hypothetical protein